MIKENCRYTKDHEWIREEGGLFLVGISHHAQDALGEVVYLELPDSGKDFSSHDTFGVVESIKAVSDLYCPVSGQVVEANKSLQNDPSQINSNPYDSWLIKIKIKNKSEFDTLMDAPAYKKYLEAHG